MESKMSKAEAFASRSCDYGYGSGDGCGSGDGSGSGDGCGSGDGSGSGCGYGDGYGYGSGSGSGYGSGYGDGSGSGYDYGDGILSSIHSICGERVWDIDGVPTVLRQIHGNVAHGAILQSDLTLRPCYVVKQDNTFAHAATLREAMEALREKLFVDMSEEERVAAFVESHEWDKPYPNRELYDWHHRLTGSCQMGRDAFAAAHGLTLDGQMTVRAFCELTRDAYGGSVIRVVEQKYGEGR